MRMRLAAILGLGVLLAQHAQAQQPLGFSGAYPLVWKVDKKHLPNGLRIPDGRRRSVTWWLGVQDISHERWAIIVKPNARLPFTPYRLVDRPPHEHAKKGRYRLEKMKHRTNKSWRTFDHAAYIIQKERDAVYDAAFIVTGRKTWFGYQWWATKRE